MLPQAKPANTDWLSNVQKNHQGHNARETVSPMHNPGVPTMPPFVFLLVCPGHMRPSIRADNTT